MKTNETCPKCSNEVMGPFQQTGDHGMEIDIGGKFNDNSIKVNRFVCLKCGYIESYIDPDDLIQIKEYLRLRGVID